MTLTDSLSVIARKPGRFTVAGLPEGADAASVNAALDQTVANLRRLVAGG